MSTGEYPDSPRVAVGAIVIRNNKVLLVKRKQPPDEGLWAIPGGRVKLGETLQKAAEREVKEETGLDIVNLRQFHTYSNPDRDPRHHTISVVFVAQARGEPKARDDAADIGMFTEDTLPEKLAFDHHQILNDYFSRKH